MTTARQHAEMAEDALEAHRSRISAGLENKYLPEIQACSQLIQTQALVAIALALTEPATEYTLDPPGTSYFGQSDPGWPPQ